MRLGAGRVGSSGFIMVVMEELMSMKGKVRSSRFPYDQGEKVEGKWLAVRRESKATIPLQQREEYLRRKRRCCTEVQDRRCTVERGCGQAIVA